MLPAYLVILVAFAYLALLFLIASRGERRQSSGPKPWRYSLILGVHCTTWAFYGTVTQAAHYGWWMAPTYLGGIAVFLFAHRFLLKLLTVVKQQNLTSIADLLGSRYAKSLFLPATNDLLLQPYLAKRAHEILLAHGVDSEYAEIDGPWGHLDGVVGIIGQAERIRRFLE